ncbi:interferon-induced very large GTPase 1-like isoform X11 [Aquarana catesbeiana]|uniref:interferon-induced very large GTPase 1-like isoform X11 n=1 Tax=Aquarana catesbeiana TaxID=8400 RepID=UPI003CC9F446
MQRTVRDIIMNALENLESRSFEKFRRKLNDYEVDENYSVIPRSRLENANVEKIADLIIDFYGDTYGIKITLEVLHHINERKTEENLRKDLEKVYRPSFLNAVFARKNMEFLSHQLFGWILPSGTTSGMPSHFHSRSTKSEGSHSSSGKQEEREFRVRGEETTQTLPDQGKEFTKEETTQTLLDLGKEFRKEEITQTLPDLGKEFRKEETTQTLPDLGKEFRKEETTQTLPDLGKEFRKEETTQTLSDLGKEFRKEETTQTLPDLGKEFRKEETTQTLSDLGKEFRKEEITQTLPDLGKEFRKEETTQTLPDLGKEFRKEETTQTLPDLGKEFRKEEITQTLPDLGKEFRKEETTQTLLDLDRRKIFLDLLTQLKLNSDEKSKLTLNNVLCIDPENLDNRKPQKIEDLPQHVLQKLMAVNITARNTVIENNSSVDANEDDNSLDFLEIQVKRSPPSVHPLDVLCALLHCSDSFLQQEIVTKMAMCQFAVPLLLPPGDGSHCTLMLWAMRDIVKKWRPQSLADSKGFKEENLVNISLSIFSFVRLGENKLSKSKVLNQVLNPVQQCNSYFICHDMEGGNIERKISDGLVEMSWYFPCGKSDVFPEPIAVANLRGDLETNWDQFMFQTRVSSAVFIFIENISEGQFRLLSSCKNTHSRFFLIFTSGNQLKPETLQYLKNLMSELSMDKTNVIVNKDMGNNTELVKKIQQCICSSNNKKQVTLENVSKEIGELSILVDENSPECQKAAKFVRNIISTIGDVEEFKKNTLIQEHSWKEWSKVEKEMCRIKKQEGKDTEEYRYELESCWSFLRTTQLEQDIPESILLFINAITHLTQKERQFFLKWTKLLLDSMARNNFFQLQKKYMEYTRLNSEELKQLDQSIYSSSLGIEHFIREIGQIYEAECYATRCNSDVEQKKQFLRLPGIFADLLMEGFPVELVDGEVSNIPIQWITGILTELDNKTGGQRKMGVISVLGVQSTGKSTLLNTMFGLQFPVASGRCTRGALMTLLKVKESFQEELGCDFILVIDTEGLKAPELAYLEDSHERDNELATLVAGLSDITIFTMAMEASTEMNDILQIVVHAFLRIEEVGKKPNCHFVHQSVGNVSAHKMNMRDRRKILDLLDKMTEVAAEMEKKTDIMTFSDVMDYDFEKHNWYFPALFQGVSPMASVNIGYSDHVFELKNSLFDFMKTDKYNFKPLKIHEFKTWMEDLWTAVKYDTFTFSFKNTLEAYNKLCIHFSQWEWQLRQKVHNWFSGTYTFIKNQSTDTLNAETCDNYKQELQDILREEKKNMLKLLESYYENEAENAHLIEEFRTRFVLSITSLIESHENSTLKKCEEAVSIQKGKIEIQNMQNRYQKLIEDKITELLQIKSRRRKVSDNELQKEFDTMWGSTLSGLHFDKINPSNVRGKMLSELKLDMKNKSPAVQEEIKQINRLVTDTQTFEMNKKYIDSSWTKTSLEALPNYIQGLYKKSEEFAQLLIDSCNKYVTGKMNSSEDYTDVYCKDLLHMINEKLEETDSKKLKFSTKFELDIKLYILANAAQKFEKMHEKFIEENDPKMCLNKLKPQYFLMFQNIFREKDECQSRAKLFYESYLEPAIVEYIFKQIGVKIVDDILSSSDKEVFTSRTCFQFTVLQSLLEEMSFKKYLRYIQSYEEFLADWILQYISDKYRNSSTLTRFKEEIFNSIEKRIADVLSDEKCLHSEDIGKYLDNVCEMLNRELVISKEGLKPITFHNKANVGEFSSYIKSLLKEKTKSILSDVQAIKIECILEAVTLKPQEEVLRMVIGCGKQCPFCKAPCEDGGIDHQEHSASIHRPEGLGRLKMDETNTLATGICTTSVFSSDKFKNPDTEWKFHKYENYKEIYPDWEIKPFMYTEARNYWKFIFVKFNKEFAKEYECEPAVLPEYWKKITKEDALHSLKMLYRYAFDGYILNPFKMNLFPFKERALERNKDKTLSQE